MLAVADPGGELMTAMHAEFGERVRQAIEAFIAAYGKHAKPFKWRKREVKGSQLRNTIVNLRN